MCLPLLQSLPRFYLVVQVLPVALLPKWEFGLSVKKEGGQTLGEEGYTALGVVGELFPVRFSVTRLLNLFPPSYGSKKFSFPSFSF